MVVARQGSSLEGGLLVLAVDVGQGLAQDAGGDVKVLLLAVEHGPEADGLGAARDDEHVLLVGEGLQLVGHLGRHSVERAQQT